MKNIFRKFIVIVLNTNVRILLKRKKPEVIAITGSAGKTSTKEFLYSILSKEFDVIAPAEGYNTEIGSALAFFGEKVPEKFNSPLRWLSISFKLFFKALLMKDYPRKVIVEMGADKPGDIKYLCKIFKPQIGIILNVLPVHLEEFKTIHAIAAEKGELARAIPQNGKLFLNWDDEEIRKMATFSKAQVTFFGFKNKEGLKIYKIKSNLLGIEGELRYNNKTLNFVTKLYGRHLIYPIVASVAVGLDEGISPQLIKETLKKLKPFKGRMNIIEGIKDSIIIDDSYNANPQSMLRALEFLGAQKGRKIALLGTMNELGEYEKEGHEIVGETAAKKVELLYTVGEPAQKYLAGKALKSGLSKKNIHSFNNSFEAGLALKKIIKAGDLILVKGSQNNVRTEIAIEQIMAHPEAKRELLVRQSAFWNERR